MRKQYQIVMSAAVLAAGLVVAGRTLAGSLYPTNAPGPTMHTLEEIYQKVDAFVSPQTLSDTTTVVITGYYMATNLAQVDANLIAENIKTNVTIFGITGILSTNTGGGASSSNTVPKTGQTISYQAGDDGDLEMGSVLPNPRFTVQTDTNMVMDNQTLLIWARNANLGSTMMWSNAIAYCEALNYGGETDWRLPNRNELLSLIDIGRSGPALPLGHPFEDVQANAYWTSSTYLPLTNNAWYVTLSAGHAPQTGKTTLYCIWPVRGGH